MKCLSESLRAKKEGFYGILLIRAAIFTCFIDAFEGIDMDCIKK